MNIRPNVRLGADFRNTIISAVQVQDAEGKFRC